MGTTGVIGLEIINLFLTSKGYTFGEASLLSNPWLWV